MGTSAKVRMPNGMSLRFDINDATECWEWSGSTDRKGYGIAGTTRQAPELQGPPALV